MWASENGLPPSYILRKPLWWLGVAPLSEMVEIPPGRFTMGSKPGRDDVEGGTCERDSTIFFQLGEVREVTLDKPFALGKYEVTFLQYDYYVWDQKRRGRGRRWSIPSTQAWGARTGR